MKTLMMLLFLLAAAAQETAPAEPPAPDSPAVQESGAWHQSDWWEIVKAMLPVVTAFAAFTYAAHRNFHYNRKLQAMSREHDRQTLATALRHEVQRMQLRVDGFLSDCTIDGRLQPDDEDKLYHKGHYRPPEAKVYAANLGNIHLLEPAAIDVLGDAHSALDAIREDYFFTVTDPNRAQRFQLQMRKRIPRYEEASELLARSLGELKKLE